MENKLSGGIDELGLRESGSSQAARIESAVAMGPEAVGGGKTRGFATVDGARLDPATDLDDFARTAQFVNYENARAMFEAWNADLWANGNRRCCGCPTRRGTGRFADAVRRQLSVPVAR
jgi:hypothetical protein